MALAIAVWKHISKTGTGVSAGVGGAFTAPSERYGTIKSAALREKILISKNRKGRNSEIGQKIREHRNNTQTHAHLFWTSFA